MNLSHLTYFKKLAEVKHYTKAAAELYIAQPTLSAAISTLEKELGAKLFYRAHGQVLLTPCGEDFYRYVTRGLHSIEKGVRVVREHNANIHAHLNLGTLYAIQGKAWSQAIQAFHEEYGAGLTIDIRQGFTGSLIRELERGNLDVVFAGRPADNSALRSTCVWAQELAVTIHKNHPLAQKREVALADLASCHILTYHEKSPVYEELVDVLGDAPLDVEFAYNDEITLSSLVTSNESAVALLCYSFLVKAFDDVVFRPLREAPREFHKVYLISRNTDEQPRGVADFITFMTNYHFPTATVRPLEA